MVITPDSPLLELWLPADAQAVPQVRHEAMQACTEAGLTDDDCFTLDLALGEALANAVMHGVPLATTLCEGDGYVYVGMWGYQNRLIIQIEDCGPGFDPPRPPYQMPPAYQKATHGRGLPLMETLTDAMVVCRGDAEKGGAAVYLVKNITR